MDMYISKESKVAKVIKDGGKERLNAITRLSNIDGILAVDFELAGCMYRLHREINSREYIEVIYEINKYLREYMKIVYEGLAEELKNGI